MKRLISDWSSVRVLRLLMGMFIIVQGIQTAAWLVVTLGALFSLMPLLNIGCCSVSGCSKPFSKNSTKAENITYEGIL